MKRKAVPASLSPHVTELKEANAAALAQCDWYEDSGSAKSSRCAVGFVVGKVTTKCSEVVRKEMQR